MCGLMLVILCVATHTYACLWTNTKLQNSHGPLAVLRCVREGGVMSTCCLASFNAPCGVHKHADGACTYMASCTALLPTNTAMRTMLMLVTQWLITFKTKHALLCFRIVVVFELSSLLRGRALASANQLLHLRLCKLLVQVYCLLFLFLFLSIRGCIVCLFCQSVVFDILIQANPPSGAFFVSVF